MDIRIQGAREHNLQAVDVAFCDGLTVVTGVSGSGKTSLVFDTLYHEARRRFQEVFSLGSPGLRLSPARVEAITGLGPTVAVGQNLLNRNPLSTLATASGLHPFLRLLYAHFGVRHCQRCSASLAVLTQDEIIERLATLGSKEAVAVVAPLVSQARGSHRTLLALLEGTCAPAAVLVDGVPWLRQPLAPAKPHDIAVEVAWLPEGASVPEARRALETATALGATAVVARAGDREVTLSCAPVCARCGTWFSQVTPALFHTPCPHCQGEGCERCTHSGLHPEAAAVRWRGLRLPELLARSVSEARELFGQDKPQQPEDRLHSEIVRRLDALETTGLGYLTLDRSSPTLSRGEAQRVRLAVALTSPLEDVVHVLDEPTIGQHPADVARLLPAFRKLSGPVIYVEHDRVAAAAADRAIDLGPGAGRDGGHLLFSGTPAGLWESDTPTGHYFSLRERVRVPAPRLAPDRFLTVRGANMHNLQGVDVPIPMGRLTVVTGVSGSGKSTLVEDVLVASLSAQHPTGCRAVEGPPLRPVLVDQSPIGANPRSNPATYTKLADVVRDYFAGATGLSASAFSFNRPEGACPTCHGMGAVEVQMRYLPSTWISCADCEGRRFSDAVLSVRAVIGDRRLSIADFYKLDAGQALDLLTQTEALPGGTRRAAIRILRALVDVGLGYLPLGQPSPTLSGGEAQRVKLAKYLGRTSLAKRLLVLDEPSTGLHPKDLAGLLVILDRLVRSGATIVVVEHNPDIIRAADWVVDLGPGAGPDGGQVLYVGPPAGLAEAAGSLTGQALAEEATIHPGTTPKTGAAGRSMDITVRDARAHNLQGVDVRFPKGALTVVTGVSGSGKSSLVSDVLEAEARRRFLETLSMYERQSTSEGPEAPVASITGLGVTIAIGSKRGRYDRRATVGTATEISHHLAVLLACAGQRRCLSCAATMERDTARAEWVCPTCHEHAPVARPRHFSPTTYAAACQRCQGIGTLQVSRPDKLIIHPDRPLCGGAMYSPGFFPKGYLCKPGNGGYDMVQALAARYGFDPAVTPWNDMAPEAQQAFLFGDPEPLTVTRSSPKANGATFESAFPGFYGWIRDWDVGGTYTDTEPCPECAGARLRPQYLAVTLGGQDVHALSEMPLSALARVLENLTLSETQADPTGEAHLAIPSLQIALRRLRFLQQVSLGYLHLNRVSATLSAGEAQRVKLAGLLGSELTALTLLFDEPSRGLHPAEVEALLAALAELRDEGNTVIVVEHDPLVMHAADHVVDMGPGAGTEGGRVVAQGTPAQVAQSPTLTGAWLCGRRRFALPERRCEPTGWLTLRGARANNLQGEDVHLPLGVLTGVCGVSGSGKSTLLIDTLGRALVPVKQTTSVAHEPVAPGEHDGIEGAPSRTILVDQARAGVTSPMDFLDLARPLRDLYAGSEDARSLGLDEAQFARNCSACNGRGAVRYDMGFLPPVDQPCEACHGTGYPPEVWEVRVKDLALPDLSALTVNQVLGMFGEIEALARPLGMLQYVGLGYLVLCQPGYALSGGEAQRLKIARELCRRTSRETLYILDEPTVGQHLEDVARLNQVLRGLVVQGHTVLVVEHQPHLLAACDWLVELGPGGGPAGGRVIAAGPPESVAAGHTPTAPYLRAVLGDKA